MNERRFLAKRVPKIPLNSSGIAPRPKMLASKLKETQSPRHASNRVLKASLLQRPSFPGFLWRMRFNSLGVRQRVWKYRYNLCRRVVAELPSTQRNKSIAACLALSKLPNSLRPKKRQAAKSRPTTQSGGEGSPNSTPVLGSRKHVKRKAVLGKLICIYTDTDAILKLEMQHTPAAHELSLEGLRPRVLRTPSNSNLCFTKLGERGQAHLDDLVALPCARANAAQGTGRALNAFVLSQPPPCPTA